MTHRQGGSCGGGEMGEDAGSGSKTHRQAWVVTGYGGKGLCGIKDGF